MTNCHFFDNQKAANLMLWIISSGGHKMLNSNNINNLNDYFFAAEKMYGNDPFLKYTENGTEHSHTYLEFSKRIRKFAQYIGDYNQLAGRRANIAVIGHTSYDYLTVMLGTVCAGSVIVPLDSQMNADTLADHLQRSDAEIIFYEISLAETVNAALKSCPYVKRSHCIADAENTIDSLISIYLY